MTAPSTTARIDTNRASAISCLWVDDNTVLATLSLGHLLELVPDPENLENKKLRPSLLADPTLARHIEERERIQRIFAGAKRTNKPRYVEFIVNAVTSDKHRGTPPILLGTTSKLVVAAAEDGSTKIGLPFGKKLVAVDGETQRASWGEVARQLQLLIDAGKLDQSVLEDIRVPVEIHHGLSVDELGDLFFERNVLGAKVNANEALSRDRHDPATQIVRTILDLTIELPDGTPMRINSLIQQASRQVTRTAPEWITLSALRTFVVTMIHGRAGLQYGAKPIPQMDAEHFKTVRAEVAQTAQVILQRYAKYFQNKDAYLIGAPSILAGIGVAAHRTLSTISMNEHISREQLLVSLDEVQWDKEGHYWDNIGTRKTPKGATTVAGPKEVGYAVADALDGTNSITAARIRGKVPVPTVVPATPSASAEPLFAQA